MSMDVTLTALCRRVEALAPGSAAGLTICNAERTCIQRALFPELPAFAASIADISLQQPYFGSCVQSVSRGEIITCADIANEDRFDPLWKQLCLEYGVRSLQSRPIYVHERPSATFVLTYREPRLESDWDVALMTFAADAAAAALRPGFDAADVGGDVPARP